jgi:hypothetical protein
LVLGVAVWSDPDGVVAPDARFAEFPKEPLLEPVLIRGSDSAGSAEVALGVKVDSDASETIPDGGLVEPVEAVRNGVSEGNAPTFNNDWVKEGVVTETAIAGVIDRDTDAELTASADTPEESAELSEAGLLGVICAKRLPSRSASGIKLLSKDSKEDVRGWVDVWSGEVEGDCVDPSAFEVDFSASTAGVDVRDRVPFVTMRFTCLGK